LQKDSVSEISIGLSELIKNYKKTKSEFDFSQRKYIEDRIKVFKTILKNPKTPFYFDEKGNIQSGHILQDRCLYCNRDIHSMRNAIFPKKPKNAERYCSKSCMVQHSKMSAKIEKFGADRIIWGGTFVRLIFDQKCDNIDREKLHAPFTIDLPTRKNRTQNFDHRLPKNKQEK